MCRAAGRDDEEASLSNVSSEEYDMHREELNGAIARRAKHFFTETARVRRGVEAWEKGDLKLFGQLMTDSGRSSIENYECGEYLSDCWESSEGVLFPCLGTEL